MKKYLCLSLLILLISGAAVTADAASDTAVAYDGYTQDEFDALTESTVIHSDDSVTGYFVTFRYMDDTASKVEIKGEWNFTDMEHATMYTTANYTPEEWHDGLFVNGPWPTSEMTKNVNGIWEYTIPLPSGAYSYVFLADGEKTLDPNAVKYADGWALDDLMMSQVYIPFEPKYQSDDRSVEMPYEGDDKGTVEYLRFNSAEEREDPVGLYLPYGYDINREQPYKLLILVHGGGGNYTDWFHQGAAVNILDNLIAEGRAEPIVVASVLNDGDIFTADVATEFLLPFLQERYHVSTNPDDLAIGGLSRGGFLTSNLLFEIPERFQYYLIMSSGILTEDRWGLKAPLDADWDYGDENLNRVRSRNTLVSTGLQDHLFPYVLEMHKRFAEHKIPFTNVMIKGGHQWDNWRQVLTYALSNSLWK